MVLYWIKKIIIQGLEVFEILCPGYSMNNPYRSEVYSSNVISGQDGQISTRSRQARVVGVREDLAQHESMAREDLAQHFMAREDLAQQRFKAQDAAKVTASLESHQHRVSLSENLPFQTIPDNRSEDSGALIWNSTIS